MTVRVIHVLDHSVPLHSGYTFRTLAILHEQRALGWETFHLTSPKHTAPGPAEEDVDGLKFYRTRWQPSGISRLPVLKEIAMMRATASRLEQLVDLVHPDIFHAHSPVLNALPALRVGRRRGLPVVYEVRALWEDAAVDHGTSREWGLRYRASRAVETYALRRVDHITTICEGLRNDIVARGIPASKVTVIPNAVDVNAFPFGAAPDVALKGALRLDRSIVIGFIGSFYGYEGLDLLVEALPEVIRRCPEARLLLVGGGPQEEALRALIAARGLQDRVIFAGRVPHEEVHRYYSIVDLFVYPRRSIRLTELVTPLKPLEAMAQGQLLIASDVGGHRELIRDGETGVLFKAGSPSALADAILRLLKERDRWPQLRARGREFVEQERNWRRSVARYREIFGNLAPSA